MNSPLQVAEFLRRQADQLDKSQLGELFGHHSDFCIAVMHAWIDGDDYRGMPIDLALRHLLDQFRLPGEAQKIDRIMEKFAEVRVSSGIHVYAGTVVVEGQGVLSCALRQGIHV